MHHNDSLIKQKKFSYFRKKFILLSPFCHHFLLFYDHLTSSCII